MNLSHVRWFIASGGKITHINIDPNKSAILNGNSSSRHYLPGVHDSLQPGPAIFIHCSAGHISIMAVQNRQRQEICGRTTAKP